MNEPILAVIAETATELAKAPLNWKRAEATVGSAVRKMLSYEPDRAAVLHMLSTGLSDFLFAFAILDGMRSHE
jgi:hypothetical protein